MKEKLKKQEELTDRELVVKEQFEKKSEKKENIVRTEEYILKTAIRINKDNKQFKSEELNEELGEELFDEDDQISSDGEMSSGTKVLYDELLPLANSSETRWREKLRMLRLASAEKRRKQDRDRGPKHREQQKKRKQELIESGQAVKRYYYEKTEAQKFENSAYQKVYRAMNPADNEERRKKENWFISYMERKNLRFGLDHGLKLNCDAKEFMRNFILLECCYCGTDEDISVDRVDSALPYSLENIVPACRLCNQMKSVHSPQEFTHHCDKIAKNLNCQQSEEELEQTCLAARGAIAKTCFYCAQVVGNGQLDRVISQGTNHNLQIVYRVARPATS